MEGQQAMNGDEDEGSYELRHAYNRILDVHVVSRTGRTSISFFWWKPLIEVETSQSKYTLVVFLSRVSILTRDIDIANMSVYPLRSGIVWKRLNILSYFFHCTVAQSF